MISLLVRDEEEDQQTKDSLDLTFINSEPLGCNRGNLTSNYHSLPLLRVPIAEAESDLESRDNDDEEEDEEDDEEDNEQEGEEDDKEGSQVIVTHRYRFRPSSACIYIHICSV